MSVLLDESPVLTGERGRQRTLALMFAALAVVAVIATDPSGLAPFGPAKWLAISTVSIASIAWTFLRRQDDPGLAVDRAMARWWTVLLTTLTLAAMSGGDVPTALLGHPTRHLGLVTWLVCAALFVCGQQIHAALDRRTAVRGAAIATLIAGLWSVWELAFGRVIDVALDTSRLTGPFGSAAFLAAGACLLGPIAIGVAADHDEQSAWRVVAGLGAAATAVALVGSGTRGAWIACVVGAVLVGLRLRPTRRVLVIAALVVVVALAAVAPRLGDVVDRSAGSSSRLDEWRVAVAVIADHPVLGVGPEGYRFAIADGIDRDYERTYGRDAVLPDRAHSGPLDVALCGGVIAGMAWVALLFLLGRRCLRLIRRGQPPVHIGLGAGVLAYGLQQLVLFPLAELDPLWWVCAGMAVAIGAPTTTTTTAATTTATTTTTAATTTAATTTARPARRFARRVAGGVAALAVPVALVAGVLDVAADRLARRSLDELAHGRRTAAVADAERATTLRPDDVRYRLAAAYVVGEIGSIADIRKALDHIEQARAWSDRDPQVADRWASLLLQLAQVTGEHADAEAAMTAWASLVDDDPHRARWQLQLGRAAVLTGDTERARIAWTIAADLSTSDHTAARLLAALDASAP